MNPEKKITWLEISLLALLTALFLWWLIPVKLAKNENKNEISAELTKKEFPIVSLEAKSVYVLDANTGEVFFEKESELQWPLASLAKLMVVFTASKLVPDYMLVRITSNDVMEEGDTGLLIGEEWNIKKLIDYSLVVSSNDGIRAIATVAGAEIVRFATTSGEILFVDNMNKLAREIGLTETYFLNQSGLDLSSNLSGGYGSARDVALLVREILKTNIHMLEATAFSKININSKNKIHNAVNTNKVLERIPNVLASKTGYTELSGGNVVVAFNVGLDRPVIISVMGSSYDGRFSDLNALVDATLQYFAK
ncbi:MAG TPA: hypothetical protein VJH25_01360 [Candidatus Paceibacterota bacterium]